MECALPSTGTMNKGFGEYVRNRREERLGEDREFTIHALAARIGA